LVCILSNKWCAWVGVKLGDKLYSNARNLNPWLKKKKKKKKTARHSHTQQAPDLSRQSHSAGHLQISHTTFTTSCVFFSVSLPPYKAAPSAIAQNAPIQPSMSRIRRRLLWLSTPSAGTLSSGHQWPVASRPPVRRWQSSSGLLSL
jgi:hypothetical protein